MSISALSQFKTDVFFLFTCLASCFSFVLEWIECTTRSVFSPVVLMRRPTAYTCSGFILHCDFRDFRLLLADPTLALGINCIWEVDIKLWYIFPHFVFGKIYGTTEFRETLIINLMTIQQQKLAILSAILLRDL